MVVPSFVRKTYLVLPKPVKRVVRVAMPTFRANTTPKAEKSFLATFDAVADRTFAPVWKELGD